MNKIILPIDTKSLYLNIKNDNKKGHTATVATPLKQGKSYNEKIAQILEINTQKICFDNRPKLIHELLKNSKSKNKINDVFVFDKISVNGIRINNTSSYCIYIKEEIDDSKFQFGRIKIHYPTTLKYEDIDIKINNKEIMSLISEALNNYAFIVKSFEYDFNSEILNFNALIVGENQVPYSKIFITEKGAGNKFSYIFNELSEDYDMEIISYRKHLGDIVGVNNFSEYVSINNKKAMDIVEKILAEDNAVNIEKISEAFPYSLFDLRYEKNGVVRYAIVNCTATKMKYFNLSVKKNLFCYTFKNHSEVFLVSNVIESPKVTKYLPEGLDYLRKTINSIKFTDEGV